MRTVFLGKLLVDAPAFRHLMVELDLVELFKAMVYERSTTALVAKFVHEVLQVFYATRYEVHFSPISLILLLGFNSEFYSVTGNWVRELGLDGTGWNLEVRRILPETGVPVWDCAV